MENSNSSSALSVFRHQDGVHRIIPESVLIINFDGSLQRIIDSDPDVIFDEAFFASEIWPDRPNSTQRLNLVNYQAFRSLREKIDLDIKFHLDLPTAVSQLFDNYSIVVVMQAPNEKSKASVNKILESIEGRPTRARVIFGTEVSWFADLERGNFTRDHIKAVYARHTLLRHTARTDVRAYRDEDLDNAVIQEFEIGIDCDLIKPRASISERNRILFVKAPEGRSTKNNAAVEQIISELEKIPALDPLKLTVLEPPYSTLDYWRLLQQSRYLVFTSAGETFSYVLNDAKAAGVIGFFPARMYENRSGAVVVDSYPNMPGRYASIPQLIETILELELDHSRLERKGVEQRRYVLQNFSVPKIAENWLNLFQDKPLNNNRILFLNLMDSQLTLDEALGLCEAYDCQFLLLYLNHGTGDLPDWGYSWLDPNHGVSIIRDFAYQTGGQLRRSRGDDGNPVSDNTGTLLKNISAEETVRFWRILTRVNKIGNIVTNLNPNDTVIELIRSQIRIMRGSERRHVPLNIEFI